MKFCAAVLVLSAVGASAFLPPASFGVGRDRDRDSTCLNLSNGILPKVTGRSSLDPAVTDRYNALPFPDDKILAEYVWVDADGNCRSKTRTLPKKKVRIYVPFCHTVFLPYCALSLPLTTLTHCNYTNDAGCFCGESSQMELRWIVHESSSR